MIRINMAGYSKRANHHQDHLLLLTQHQRVIIVRSLSLNLTNNTLSKYDSEMEHWSLIVLAVQSSSKLVTVMKRLKRDH